MVFIYFTTKRLYKYFQNKLLTKLRQWIRFKLTEMLLVSNNESLSNMNFTKLSSPISRTATTCFNIVSDILTYIIPSVVFILINLGFLFYYDSNLGFNVYNWKYKLDGGDLYVLGES